MKTSAAAPTTNKAALAKSKVYPGITLDDADGKDGAHNNKKKPTGGDVVLATAGVKSGANADGGKSADDVKEDVSAVNFNIQYEFEDHYELVGQKIAEGSFGAVHVAKHKATNREFAAKLIKRQNLSKKDSDNVMREISILKSCRDVDGIVQLVDFYVSSDCYYVVQVYAEGGDVFERLATRQTYNEKLARDLARNLIQVIAVLHERKVVHRDLKPENLLLKSMMDDTGILVADFGFARKVPAEGLKTRCGTPAFVAPEVLQPNARYDEKVDMWSVGCLLYMIVGGYPPFQATSHRVLFRKIQGADFCFHEKYWKNVSVSAKQLIASLLTVHPGTRCTAQMAIDKSSWLKAAPTRLESNDLSSSLDQMKQFRARASLKGAIHTVLWSVRSKFKTSDYGGLAKQIKVWDKTDEQAAIQSNGDVLGADDDPDNMLEPKTDVRPTLKFHDVYELRDKIRDGTGLATTIYRCEHKLRKGIVRAVKVVDRQKSAELATSQGAKSAAETICHEVAVLKSLDHPYLIHCIDFFDEDDYYYMVMENMEGGDVFDRIALKQCYTEKDARGLARFLLEAVGYLHSKNICHRDIKPQNLLLKTRDDNAEIKIAGFGFACRVHTPQSLTKRCGTPSYVAPEILKNIPYDQSADMWSVGVILYVLLCGYPPFAHENQSALFEKVRIGEYDFRGQAWKAVSEEAKDVIRHLLVVDPGRRWTAAQALQSEWLREDDVSLEKIDLTQNVQDGIMNTGRRGKASDKFRNVAKAIMCMNALGESKRDNLSAIGDLIARSEEAFNENSDNDVVAQADRVMV